MQVQTRGEFGGLGLEVSMENGVVKVVSPIEDTPAARAGLQSGDFITALDKEQLQGLTLEEAVEKMRGPVNAAITLTIVRKGVENPFDVKMVRDVIHIKPVKYSAEKRRGLYPHHELQRTDHGGSAGRRQASEEGDRSEASRATSSTFATIRAACSTKRSRSPMTFSTRAPS